MVLEEEPARFMALRSEFFLSFFVGSNGRDRHYQPIQAQDKDTLSHRKFLCMR